MATGGRRPGLPQSCVILPHPCHSSITLFLCTLIFYISMIIVVSIIIVPLHLVFYISIIVVVTIIIIVPLHLHTRLPLRVGHNQADLTSFTPSVLRSPVPCAALRPQPCPFPCCPCLGDTSTRSLAHRCRTHACGPRPGRPQLPAERLLLPHLVLDYAQPLSAKLPRSR